MKKVITVALIGGAAALGFAGVANATPGEDAVVQQMESAGYPHTPVAQVIDNAHNVCERVGRGTPRPEVANQIVNEVGIGIAEATLFVDVSVANLCP